MRQKLVLLVELVLLVVLGACAKQGYPSGGPRDTKPPKSIASKPGNESRNFKGSQFFVEFDEYVVLRNATENVLISPPMAVKPDFSTRGKGVLVHINDTLKPNTTYLFQFKEAIADFTEGNVLPSFEYVFSTGDAMDTMQLAGRVENARDGKPWSEVLTVTAYRHGDTVPAFITRTDKEGHFAFHYIPQGEYRLLAVDDKNRNLLADSTEAVAWDTLYHAALDSIDSAAAPLLRISTPDRRKQRVLKAEFTEAGRVTISTLMPMVDPVLTGEPLEWRFNSRRDTIFVWTLNEKCDSTQLILTDEGLNDTLRLKHRVKPQRGRQQSSQAKTKTPIVKTLCSGSNAYYDDLRLAFTSPSTLRPDATVEIMNMADSSVSSAPLVADSNALGARIMASLQSGKQYRIRLADSVVTDLYGRPSDSLSFTLTPKDYGILIMHIDNHTGSPLVIEVLDSKDTVVQKMSTDNSQAATIRFTHLPAGDYRVRAVVDSDGNGQWTTGDYLAGRQPEAFFLYNKTLQLREKWEMEERWTVGAKEVKEVRGVKEVKGVNRINMKDNATEEAPIRSVLGPSR